MQTWDTVQVKLSNQPPLNLKILLRLQCQIRQNFTNIPSQMRQNKKPKSKSKIKAHIYSSSDESLSNVYTMKKASGRFGTRGCPGLTISKPRKLNVRSSEARSSLFLWKQMKTCSAWRCSSANSSRMVKLSLLPSGKAPPGSSMYRLLLFSITRQWTILASVSLDWKWRILVLLFALKSSVTLSRLSEYSKLAARLWSLWPFPRPPGIFKGGWGTSGAPQRPRTRVTTAIGGQPGTSGTSITTKRHGWHFVSFFLSSKTVTIQNALEGDLDHPALEGGRGSGGFSSTGTHQLKTFRQSRTRWSEI